MYITIGSECVWQQWEVDAIYDGILEINKQQKVRAVWSFKSDTAKMPDGYDENLFWVSTWLPQVELLAHRAVVAGLSHCGFGGTVEFISAAIPLLTLAHFGDQPMNA